MHFYQATSLNILTPFFTIIVVCGPELGNNTFSIRQIHIFHWANLLDHFFI